MVAAGSPSSTRVTLSAEQLDIDNTSRAKQQSNLFLLVFILECPFHKQWVAVVFCDQAAILIDYATESKEAMVLVIDGFEHWNFPYNTIYAGMPP